MPQDLPLRHRLVALVLVVGWLVWFGLVWFGLGWVGLGWVGLGWLVVLFLSTNGSEQLHSF